MGMGIIQKIDTSSLVWGWRWIFSLRCVWGWRWIFSPKIEYGI